MEILSFKPATIRSYALPTQEVRILPVGDIQYGAPCDLQRLKKHVS